MRRQLFAKKSLSMLMDEMAGEHRLRRVLGPITLTSLGVGAVIGVGIFVATASAAKDVAGPALMVSYIVAGITCVFAALCYAEFASMAPVAGSAYTYAYTTMGELVAWIIGWDLILEYAVGAAAVANGWSGYFQNVAEKFAPSLGLATIIPFAVSGAPYKYDEGHILPNVVAKYNDQVVTQKVVLREDKSVEGIFWVVKESGAKVGLVHDSAVEAELGERQQAIINLPAVLIVALMTAVLVKGIRESAGFNAAMVLVKVAAVIFVIVVGAYYVNPENWRPFAPKGWTGITFFGHQLLGEHDAKGNPVGMLAGTAIIFFAYIGFDSVSTHAEEAIRPQRDVPFAIITSLLICTVLYVGVVAVVTGMVPAAELSKDAGVADAFKQRGLPWAQVIIACAGVAGITSVLLVMMLSAPRVILAMSRDGLLPAKFFADVHPRFLTPWKSTILIGVLVALPSGLLPIDALLHLCNIGTLFAFVVVCASVLVMRVINPTAPRPFRCPLVPLVPILGILCCLMLMFSLPPENWWRLFGWLGLGLAVYFCYGYRHSHLRHALEHEIRTHGISPAGMPADGPPAGNPPPNGR